MHGFQAFVGGVFLSFGGLFSLVLGGGEAELTASYPGAPKLVPNVPIQRADSILPQV